MTIQFIVSADFSVVEQVGDDERDIVAAETSGDVLSIATNSGRVDRAATVNERTITMGNENLRIVSIDAIARNGVGSIGKASIPDNVDCRVVASVQVMVSNNHRAVVSWFGDAWSGVRGG